jgi:DNA polymerase-3 subunit alpha
MDDTDRLVIMKRDCEQNGLTLLPPDINDSGSVFEIRDAASMRYGLGALKGLGHGAADQIIAARVDGPFRSLDDFCERVHTHKVGRRAIEALIKSGAMDSLGPNRPSLLARVPTAIGHAERAARARDSGQNDMFAMPGAKPEATLADAGVEITIESDWSFRDKLEAERESLGLYMSGHPFDEYRHDGPFVSSGTLSSLTSAPPPKSNGDKPWSGGRDCSAAGLVTGLRKRGGRVTFELDDGVQRLEVTLFHDAYDRFRHLLTPESIVVVSGKIRFDDFINGWRLNGKEVASIDRVVESKASKLIIRWCEDANGGLDPTRLKSILEPYRPGGCEISLYYLRGDAQARVLLGRDWAVRPSRELREQLMRIVGDDGYRFIYQTLH